MLPAEYDVFLSHNSLDKALVVKLKSLLGDRHLRAWLDKDELTPGEPWQPLLAEGVAASRTIAVCSGPSGRGPWQTEEVELALRNARSLGKRVIPVLLPSAPVDATFPPFVESRTRVDCRDGFTQAALDDLEWGITDRKPGPSVARPHNLPRLPWFFGRTTELEQVAEALDLDVRGWGALIDGPGGMGKTALAIRSAELAAPRFERVIFISAKARELDPEGVRPIEHFVLPAFGAMVRELGAEFGIGEQIDRAPDGERVTLVNRALRDHSVLIVFDNLESLSETDRVAVYTFLDRLPRSSKAIVTSRRRSDVGARTLRLERLDDSAAQALVNALAEDRPALRQSSAGDRARLVQETGANPLLLRWVAGQIGRGRCHTVPDALALLREAPADNDPLEFIFGDLALSFTPIEAGVLGALSHFTAPVELRHVVELSGTNRAATQMALENLAFRALVNSDAESRRFLLAPLVGDWLRRARFEVVRETGDRLTGRAYALLVENGGDQHDRFPIIESEWPIIDAALPEFLTGDNARLQTICDSLRHFLYYSGRWALDRTLSTAAERRATVSGDFENAGWRAFDLGFAWHLLGDGQSVLACADRASEYWRHGRHQSFVDELRADGYDDLGDYGASLAHSRAALAADILRDPQSENTVHGIANVAAAERRVGNLEGARRDAIRALEMCRRLGYSQLLSAPLQTLADVAQAEGELQDALQFAREGLASAEAVGNRGAIGMSLTSVASVLCMLGRHSEGLPLAQRAVDTLMPLQGPDLLEAQRILKLCMDPRQ